MARKRYPGKFEGCADDRLAEVLYSITMTGCDEEVGSVDELGWYGLILHRRHGYIVSEDGNGFFCYEYHDTKEEAQAEYNRIESDIADEYQALDESNGGAF